MNINNPIPAEWTGYVTQTNLGLEVVPSMLYSVKSYVSGTTVKLTLFDFVDGSREDLTNMQQPNMLPNPEAFLIENIRVFFWNDVQSDDLGGADSTPQASQFDDNVELSRGILKMRIGNKNYGPWPIWTLPAHNFVKGMGTTGDTGSFIDYGQIDGYLYNLQPNLMIAPLQQFTVSLEWPAGAITLSTDSLTPPANQLPIEVLFDGKLARSIQ